MQGISPLSVPPGPHLTRKIAYFLSVPISVTVLITLLLVLIITTYQARHRNLIFTGVFVGEVDLSGMSRTEAETAVTRAFPYPNQPAITFVDSKSGQQWVMRPGDLGLSLDAAASVEAALQGGREGNLTNRLQTMFESWYYGRNLSPILTLDESKFK